MKLIVETNQKDKLDWVLVLYDQWRNWSRRLWNLVEDGSWVVSYWQENVWINEVSIKHSIGQASMLMQSEKI